MRQTLACFAAFVAFFACSKTTWTECHVTKQVACIATGDSSYPECRTVLDNNMRVTMYQLILTGDTICVRDDGCGSRRWRLKDQ